MYYVRSVTSDEVTTRRKMIAKESKKAGNFFKKGMPAALACSRAAKIPCK